MVSDKLKIYIEMNASFVTIDPPYIYNDIYFYKVGKSKFQTFYFGELDSIIYKGILELDVKSIPRFTYKKV